MVFRIDKGDEIKVLEKSNSKDVVRGYGEDYWYKIEHSDLKGWVFGKLIGKNDYETTLPSNWDGEFIVINGNNVNVRSEPSTIIGKVKFKVNRNDKVEVVAKTSQKYKVKGYGEDFWYYIKKNDRSGWVFGSLTKSE